MLESTDNGLSTFTPRLAIGGKLAVPTHNDGADEIEGGVACVRNMRSRYEKGREFVVLTLASLSGDFLSQATWERKPLEAKQPSLVAQLGHRPAARNARALEWAA